MDIDGLHDSYGDPQEITQFTPDGNSMVSDFMIIEYLKVTCSDLFFLSLYRCCHGAKTVLLSGQ